MRVVVSIVLLVGVAVHAQAPPPAFELPAPTGKMPVGTTRWVVVDPSREETFAPGKRREVEVIAWYPAASAAGAAGARDTAPYMRDGMEEVLSFARLAKLGDAYDGLANVQTHSVIDAPPANTPARFPVIVFSHGYTGLPSSHTGLMEDLASHGRRAFKRRRSHKPPATVTVAPTPAVTQSGVKSRANSRAERLSPNPKL